MSSACPCHSLFNFFRSRTEPKMSEKQLNVRWKLAAFVFGWPVCLSFIVRKFHILKHKSFTPWTILMSKGFRSVKEMGHFFLAFTSDFYLFVPEALRDLKCLLSLALITASLLNKHDQNNLTSCRVCQDLGAKQTHHEGQPQQPFIYCQERLFRPSRSLLPSL